MATSPRKQTAPTARTSAVDAVTTKTEEKNPVNTTVEVKPETAPTAPEKKKRTVTSAPLDLTALTVEAAPAPKIATGAGRKAVDNSVAENWLRESWDARESDSKIGGGKAVTIPTNAVGTLKSRLNMAAKTLDLGVAIQVDDAGSGKSRVTFAAKVRKQRRQAQ